MNSNFPDAKPAQKTGIKFRHIAVLLLLAFIGGIGLAAWLATQYGILDRFSPKPATAITAPKLPAPQIAPAAPALLPAPQPDVTAPSVGTINTANRSEAMMIAFAARRAVEGGTSLGNIAGQLQQRFGASAPDAVQNIIAAAQAPVTLSRLQSEFDGIDASLLTANPDAGLWATIQREAAELFVLRRGNLPANNPASRLNRAQQMIKNGDIAGAVDQVEPLPGAARASNWLQKARRYIATENALNVIERAALAPVVVDPAAAAQAVPPTLPMPAPMQPEAEAEPAAAIQPSGPATAQGPKE
jgi:hypothetical protein